MAHRIDGRKLSRKMGPRLALYKALTVAVLRYERVKTTEAKAKEIRGQVEHMITIAKRGDLSARRAVVDVPACAGAADRHVVVLQTCGAADRGPQRHPDPPGVLLLGVETRVADGFLGGHHRELDG